MPITGGNVDYKFIMVTSIGRKRRKKRTPEFDTPSTPVDQNLQSAQTVQTPPSTYNAFSDLDEDGHSYKHAGTPPSDILRLTFLDHLATFSRPFPSGPAVKEKHWESKECRFARKMYKERGYVPPMVYKNAGEAPWIRKPEAAYPNDVPGYPYTDLSPKMDKPSSSPREFTEPPAAPTIVTGNSFFKSAISSSVMPLGGQPLVTGLSSSTLPTLADLFPHLTRTSNQDPGITAGHGGNHANDITEMYGYAAAYSQAAGDATVASQTVAPPVYLCDDYSLPETSGYGGDMNAYYATEAPPQTAISFQSQDIWSYDADWTTSGVPEFDDSYAGATGSATSTAAVAEAQSQHM
ncbi:hypothetical protein H0H92_010618, partial [Tricholoma furcatifolium]